MFNNFREQFSDIRRAVNGVFGYLFEYKSAMAKTLLIPVLLLFAIGYLQLQGIEFRMAMILVVLSSLIYAVFAITIHRIILLGPESVPTWGIYKLTKREGWFVIYGIGLGLILALFSMFVFIPFIGAVLFPLAIIYMLGRLSLVFPAIATDNQITFVESWERTARHQVLMIGVVGIFPVILSIPEIILSEIPHMELVSTLISLLATMLTVAALSMAYKIISENKADSNFVEDQV